MTRWAWLLLATTACSGTDNVEHVSAAERGQRLFEDDKNGFACATCHVAEKGGIAPGASLGGVTRRDSFWGGAENDLLRAVNACRTLFQQQPAFERAEPDAEELYAYLTSLKGSGSAVSFTVVPSVGDLAAGDAKAGSRVFEAACARCHGRIDTGTGQPWDGVPILPGDPLREHAHYGKQEQRLVFVEKVRHGAFLGYSGHMPPFSREVLSDEQLADLLSALGLYGE